MPKTRSRKRWAVISFLLLLTIVSCGLVEYLFSQHQKVMRDELTSRIKEELAVVRFKAEASLLADIYVAKGLSTLVTINPATVINNWNSYSSGIVNQGKYIRSLALAPNDVIRYVYPLKPNQSAIGTDFRDIPAQWETVTKAREIQDIFIAGPVNLVQGGKALIARCPVFLDPPMNKQYWGVISVVINMDKLFADLRLNSSMVGYDVAVRGTDSLAEKGDVFWGKASVFDKPLATENVVFPYGGWQIAVASKGNLLEALPWIQTHIVRVVGYLLLILLITSFVVIYRLYDRSDALSFIDELTSLPNRRFFMNELEQRFDRAHRREEEHAFVLLSVDINAFKKINDEYGHLAGDRVLIEVAARIRKAVRKSDTLARIGGDEFLAIAEVGEDDHSIDIVRERIMQAVSSEPISIDKKTEISVSISIGSADFSPQMKSVEELYRLADSSMYHYKKAN